MERRTVTARRPAARRALLVGLAALLATTATACGGRNTLVGKPPAARVGGEAITREQVDALATSQLAFSKAAVKAGIDPTGQSQQTVDLFTGTGSEKTTGVAGSASALTSLIQRRIYEEAVLASGGRLPTAKAIAAEVTTLEKQVTDAKLKLSPKFRLLIEEQAALRLLNEKLLGADKATAAEREQQLKDAYDQQVANYTQVCVLLIVSDSEANGKKALARVQGGTPFATVAKEESLDPTSAAQGGDAGCVAVADVAPVFGEGLYTANVGDVLGPAASQGSWLTIQVTRFDVPTLEDIRDQLEQNLPKGNQAAARKAFDKAAEHLAITVDPRFGTWDPKNQSVVPPADPASGK